MNDACPRCGAALAAGRLEACAACLLAPSPEPVLIGGAFQLEDEIGRGGMGAVLRARDLKLGREVAVKFLPEELAARPDARARFDREARALALLNHPNIVAVYDVGREENQAYIVMELVDGGSLARRLPLPLDRAVDVAIQVCDALAYAHDRGVVHRDIKPENILLDAAGRPKVSDFGIARIVRPDARGLAVTGTDMAAGTPHYIAPEALAGAPPDPRMDVYSLGVMIYEMATGRVPVGNFDSLPGPLDRVVRRALSPDPAKRYGSAREMLADLRGLDSAPAADLPPDERVWIYLVALLQSISTAIALWTLLVTVSPLILPKAEVRPLIHLWVDELPDGRVVSRLHFEIGWTILTLAVFAAAISAYGMLRLHWRNAGIERADPGRPVEEVKWVAMWGVIAVALYAARLGLEAKGHGWVRAPSFIGGVFVEIMALFALWVSILQAWRVSRPLRSLPWMWIGFALALVPPGAQLLGDLIAWRP
jgi:hypothetical protein